MTTDDSTAIKIPLTNKQVIYATGLMLGALAFIVNAFFVAHMAGGIPLYFGSAFVLLSLLALPLHVAVLVLCASMAPILLYDSPIYIAWLHSLEFVVIALLIHYRIRFLTAVLLFWLLIGLPICSVIVDANLSLRFQVSVFIALPFVLNAYICSMLALLVYWLLPVNSQFRQFRSLPKFSKVVFEFNLVSVMLPFFIVLLFFIWHSTHDSEIAVALELDNALEELNRSSIGLLDDKVHAVQATAVLLVNESNPQNHAQILDTVANASANIESMIVTNAAGKLLLAAPVQYAAKLPDLLNLDMSFREYFQQTKKSRKPVISTAIRGSGLGSLDIVAITAPILRDNAFDGVVQAAIKLDRLVDLSVINAIQNGQIAVIVTDANDSIIYSSPIFGLNKLDRFEKKLADAAYTFALPKITLSENEYLYKMSVNQTGWKLYTLITPNRIFKDTTTYFIFMIIILVLSMMFIAILSKGLASNIVRPLRNLEAYIKGHTRAEKLIEEAKVSQEMFNVTTSVIKTQKLSLDFQHELKKQVKEKTNELQVLNSQLLRVSRTDSLTGLYNRGAFDELSKEAYGYCRRNKKPFTLILLDIDHFKNINDSYGHIAGDQCLVNVANIIADMCRRDTDITARYGGEEFVLFFASDKPEQHLQHINLLHQAIGEYQTVFNGQVIQLTASCGVIRVENNFSLEVIELISLADEQLYISKDNGRNQVNAAII